MIPSLRSLGAAVIAMAGATLAVTAPTTTPLSYSTTFTDPSGTQQSVSFTGTASGMSLTGPLTVHRGHSPEDIAKGLRAEEDVDEIAKLRTGLCSRSVRRCSRAVKLPPTNALPRHLP